MSFTPFNWNCPHCGMKQVVTEPVFSFDHNHLYVSVSCDGRIGLSTWAYVCVNQECKKLTVRVRIGEEEHASNGWRMKRDGLALFDRRLIPESAAKSQPEYIPLALREDYLEACLIRDLSPKASATLSRRCLQGMLRDFCGVKGNTLFKEIEQLKALVAADNAPSGVSIDSVDAIDHVRSVGNIGAHMEKNIDHIIPVEPEEAQLLIELIESLFEEWYVVREKRTSRFSGIKSLAESKQKLIDELKKPQIEPPLSGD
ncbi:MAG: DUF4145 domain-containing protein [Paracoccaceae bacterium]